MEGTDSYSVLIVDDDKSTRKSIACYLGARGITCLSAEDGEHALNAIEAHHPDVVLLDIMMPGLSGIEVAGRIAKTHSEDAPPLLETRDLHPQLHYISLAEALFHDDDELQRYHDHFEPDAVLGINTYPASRAVSLDTDRPYRVHEQVTAVFQD